MDRPSLPDSTSRAHVRDLHGEDVEAVLALGSRLTEGVAPWRDEAAVREAVRGWVADSVRAADPGQRPVFVAEQAGTVIGFVTVTSHRHWSGQVDACVGELVVAPGHESRGVGRHLMSHAEQWAYHHGYHRLTIQTGAGNQRALRLYQGLGYRPEDVTLTRTL